MEDLSYKYKTLEVKEIDGNKIFKVKDFLDEKIFYIVKYKEISDTDWDASTRIEEELESFLKKKEISDYFYNTNYSNNKKIFYKVLKNYKDFAKETENKLEKSDYEKKEDIDKTENKFSDGKDIVTKIQDDKVEKEKVKSQKKVYKLNEIGGKVKVDLPSKNNNDIFTRDLNLNTVKTQNNQLILDYKKSAPRHNLTKEIICKYCGSTLDKEKIDYEKGVAFCNKCHSVRPIEKLSSFGKINDKVFDNPPDGIEIKKNSDRFSIKIPLKRIEGILGVVFLLFFIFLYSGGVDIASEMERGLFSNGHLFLLGFYVITGGIFYKSLLNAINSIHIDIDKNRIDIVSKPLPHFFKKEFKSGDIKQIYVRENKWKSRGQTYYVYKVIAQLNNGKEKTLFKISDPVYALYLEEAIESWLGIVDEYVPGSFKR